MNLFCIIDCFVIYVTGVLTPDLLTCGECIGVCEFLALPSTKVGVFHAPAFSCDGPLSWVASLECCLSEGSLLIDFSRFPLEKPRNSFTGVAFLNSGTLHQCWPSSSF